MESLILKSKLISDGILNPDCYLYKAHCQIQHFNWLLTEIKGMFKTT